MVSSSGSFPWSPRPGFSVGRLGFVCGFLLAAAAIAAPQPDYLRRALTGFDPDPPAAWAYTLTTTRNTVRMVERYDPSRAPTARWTLLEWEGRTPTGDEREKYARSRPQGEAGGTKANFKNDDIEPGSLTLVREDDTLAEFTGSFRSTSTGGDKMLGHLTLRLVVDKRTSHVAEYSLALQEPYSPVLGVKMNQLDVVVRYQAPAGDQPALPTSQTSRFAGRILFFTTEEELSLTYSDYAPPSPELSR